MIVKRIYRALKKLLAGMRLWFIRTFCKFSHTASLSLEQARVLLDETYIPPMPYGTAERETEDQTTARVAVSVVIPVYNGEKHLRQCLDSVIHQECRYQMEVICVDDGSTDSSPEILEAYAAEHGNIKIITQKNKGISGARNAGLREAVGRYILLVDNDDILDSAFLEIMLQNAESTDADIVKCGYQVLQNGSLTRKSIESKDCVLKDAEISGIYKFNGYCWGTLFRRELLFGFMFPEGYWYEDMVTRLVLYPRCRVFSYVGKALYYYRVHQTNASATVWKKENVKALDQLYLAERAFALAQEGNIPFSVSMCLAYQYEIGKMLYLRTLYLKQDLRMAAFVVACDLNSKLITQCPTYETSGTLSEKLLNMAFQERDFVLWNRICQNTLSMT